MGRTRRLYAAGITYHVTARGDNREAIFCDDDDCQRYLLFLKKYKTKWGFKLYAYALMPNHIHLLIRPTTMEDSLSKILHDVQLQYAKYFNRRYQRVGHLFQGPFHSPIVKKDSYLLAASRYIHLNPVRAKLSKTAYDYPWTSFRAYVDQSADPLNLVDTTLILSVCSSDMALQRQVYQNLIEIVPGTKLEKLL